MFHSDKRRVIDHGYDETNYRLLCLVEPGTEADFEMMKTQWLSDLKTRSMKIYSKGKQIYFDKFGREFTVNQEPLAIEWSERKLYLSFRGLRVAYQDV